MNHQQHYLNLDPILYHQQPALALDNPKLVHFNHLLYQSLSDEPFHHTTWQNIIGADNDAFLSEFKPLAMVYAGHQFGQWAGQLGDGRGLLLTQVIDKQGKLQDLHLKGAGRTPFSRFGDGRAMVASTVREYLGSHALTSLGVASSNALGFVISDTLITRTQMERAAALLRVSDCHVRLGHFEWLAVYAPHLFAKFTYQMMTVYYPHLPNTAINEFLFEVCQNTAKLIADWQLVGFSHGVMNTDNLNITGSTLDFGPFAMMERFKPDWISNHSDHHGRYTYQNQPTIGHWNLQKWLSCFELVSVGKEVMMEALTLYEKCFHQHYDEQICQKIGLAYCTDNLQLAYDFIHLLKTYELDYTNSFRALIALVDDSLAHQHEHTLLATMQAELQGQTHGLEHWQDWETRYKTALEQSTTKAQALKMMTKKNPVYVLRNQMAERAIQATLAEDFREVARLFDLLQSPFTVQDIATINDITPSKPHEMTPVSCMS